MTPARRWCLVLLGVTLVIGTPLGMRAIPAADSEMSASALLGRIEASGDHAYAGYVETLGTLQLPVDSRFTDIGALFGERTRIRVWWRSSKDWRVDKILPTGETDLFHRGVHTAMWEYEEGRVTLMRDPDIRLPRTADLLPPQLARLLLEDVDSRELSRLPAQRVAGRDAAGLRVTPAAPQSSIDHVDIWADPGTGVPVRLAVYANGATSAAFTSEFMQFSAASPTEADTAFTNPPAAEFTYHDVVDIADAANQYAPLTPPDVLAGLPRSREAALGAVGSYGRGVTRLIAIPLWDRAAKPLREQLEITPGVRVIDEGDVLDVGPLGVLLTEFPYDAGGYLIAGTVTDDTLVEAAHSLMRHRMVPR